MTSPIAQRQLGSSGLQVGAIGSVPRPPFPEVKGGDADRSRCNGLKYDALKSRFGAMMMTWCDPKEVKSDEDAFASIK
jgi:hypothetical protein